MLRTMKALFCNKGLVHLFLVKSSWMFYRQTDISTKGNKWKLPHSVLRL